MKIENSVNIIKALCETALKGELDLQELYKLWPKGIESNPAFEIIFEDLEDAVEHFSPQEDFKKTDKYWRLKLDVDLLDKKLTLEKIAAILTQAKGLIPLNQERIDKLISAIE